MRPDPSLQSFDTSPNRGHPIITLPHTVYATPKKSGWQRIKQALARETITPAWLPENWRSPMHTYFYAGLIAIIATLLADVVVVVMPDFRFSGIFVLFTMIGVTLLFGLGPGLFSAILGSFLFINVVLLPRSIPPSQASIDDFEDTALYIALAMAINFTIGQAQRMKQRIIASKEEANYQMEVFLSVTSHELRNPLTSLLANTQLQARVLQRLQTTEADPTFVANMDRLREMSLQSEKQLRRLDRLINDLLDASRIDAGKLQLNPGLCDINRVVTDAVHDQRAANPERLIDLHVGIPLTIRADADRIGQVVTNFLTNAVKYSNPDTMIMVIVTHDGRTAKVAVRDNGPGISPEKIELLWQPFYRVPGIEIKSGTGVGLGLGLYICKTIVERHGGAIGVSSSMGQGSTFWFTLPIVASS